MKEIRRKAKDKFKRKGVRFSWRKITNPRLSLGDIRRYIRFMEEWRLVGKVLLINDGTIESKETE
eukprot:snap_masked-scaffold_9-processed-gene-13.86-mRNA-1 protein AED:1.00 eAED:1.00 QI:0/0/0/0/1/1/2/0/64